LKRTIFILLILFSCCKEQSKAEGKIEEKIQRTDFGLDFSDFAILKFNPEWHWIFENSKPSPADLKLNELSKIESILEKAIIEHNSELENDSRWRLELEGYNRQYVAILNEKGEKEVWINFFCDTGWTEDQLKSYPYEVDDGGNCFFNIKINLTTGSYGDLRINSIA